MKLLDNMWLFGGRGQLTGRSKRFSLPRRQRGNCSALREGPVLGQERPGQSLSQASGPARPEQGACLFPLSPEHLLRGVETPQGQGLEQFFLRPRQNEPPLPARESPRGSGGAAGAVAAPPGLAGPLGCTRERQDSPKPVCRGDASYSIQGSVWKIPV